MIKNTRQKGRKVVTYAIPLLRKYDPSAYECVGSGQGTHDKGDARMPTYKTTLEFKNTKQISAEVWIHEIEKDSQTQGDRYGILIWRCTQSPESNPRFHSAIDTWDLMELLQDAHAYRQLSDEEREIPAQNNSIELDFISYNLGAFASTFKFMAINPYSVVIILYDVVTRKLKKC